MLMRAYREAFPLGDGRYGLTQASLLQRMSEVNGQYAGRYSHVTVSRWESGSTLPTVERLQDFANALNLAPVEVEGLMILAGFQEDAGPYREQRSSDWTDADAGEDAYLEPQPRPVPAGEHVVSSANDRAASNLGSDTLVPDTLVPDMGSIIRYLSYKCVLMGVCIAAVGYAFAAFGWNNTWMPVVYVAAMMSLVAAQGLLHRRRPYDLGEFYSTTVFFLLSTFLLQSAYIRMDPYGLYMIGDYAGTHLPYLLALEVNLALASIAGLAFHLLRQWQYSGDQSRSNALRRAVAVTVPPTLFGYASIVVFSNISLWIQLVIVLPPLAGVFMALLVLRDPAVRPNAGDRRLALVTTIALLAAMGSLGAGVVVTTYLAPNTPSVLPDHNWWTSWEIDFSRLDYPQEEAQKRLNSGYLWHGLATFFYVVGVVGGALISSIFRIGKDDGARAAAREPMSAKLANMAATTWARRARSTSVDGRMAEDVVPGKKSRERTGLGGVRTVVKLATAREPGKDRLAVC